jgi:Na+(H+)/acetate symporter ActP
VIGAAFAVIIVIGLLAGRWRKADLSNLDEWALGGRQFGGVLTWFLQGGSVYTTYSFIAVPALVFGAGAIGFFALPYLIIAYIVAFLIVPKLWTISRARGYVTPADFVRERFASRPLAAAITLTGIVATMPYIALQVYGIEICMAQIGLPVQASLWLAFALLAVITYVSGLRSATLIAIVKDVMIWVTVIVAVIRRGDQRARQPHAGRGRRRDCRAEVDARGDRAPALDRAALRSRPGDGARPRRAGGDVRRAARGGRPVPPPGAPPARLGGDRVLGLVARE